MRGDSFITIAAIVAALGTLTILFVLSWADDLEHMRAIRRRLSEIERSRPQPTGDESLWGDVKSLPKEMRPARNSSGGGASEQRGRAGAGHVRTHDGGDI
jgi:hypothetical protein